MQEAMATLGMEVPEIKSLMKVLAGILHFGNIEVTQRPREETANIPTTTGKWTHRGCSAHLLQWNFNKGPSEKRTVSLERAVYNAPKWSFHIDL